MEDIEDQPNPRVSTEFLIGVSLAVLSSIFIGSSFIIKKIALIKLNTDGQQRAGDGGHGYLKEWRWWTGLLSMGFGEILNVIAYAFAPASVVTPLGALSILVTAVLSSKFLGEKFDLSGKLGCCLCIIGSSIIIFCSPKEMEIKNLPDVLEKMTDTVFICYCGVIVVISLFIGVFAGPKYGKKNVVWHIVLCSAIGSLSVLSVKVFCVAVRDAINGSNDFLTPYPYVAILATLAFITIQTNYLNKALDVFKTNVVTPVYYVVFTIFVIAATGILFKEWTNMSLVNIFGDSIGFCMIILAVFMLNGNTTLIKGLNCKRTKKVKTTSSNHVIEVCM